MNVNAVLFIIASLIIKVKLFPKRKFFCTLVSNDNNNSCCCCYYCYRYNIVM